MANYTSLGTGHEAGYSFTAADHGLLATSVAPHLTSGTVAPTTAGRLEFVKLRLPSAASVTNILMCVTTVGATLTAGQCFSALYTGAGALVGTTADQAAAWVSTGVKTMALASGPFPCAAGNYYVAFWYNGTTSPTWRTGASAASTSLVNWGVSAPNLYCGFADTGLTTTSPATMGAQSGQPNVWWAGLS